MSVCDSLFHFLCPIALAKHNSVYRAIYAPKTNPPRELLPGSAFSGYVAQFQEPSLDEGFDELRGVNFVFEGSEDERKKWDMWMLEVK
jgi:bifunctional polynucleotide phosphatase/kinase